MAGNEIEEAIIVKSVLKQSQYNPKWIDHWMNIVEHCI